MKKKTVTCKVCGKEIAKSAKTCPDCGAKNKKPIYKRAWFIALVVIILIVGIGGSGGSDSTEPNDEEITYTSYDLQEMLDELENNALKAEETYADAYIRVEGQINVIDSDGNYISICPIGEDFVLIDMQCYLQNEEHKEVVMEKTVGDTVVIEGKVKSIGEILGYTVDIATIE